MFVDNNHLPVVDCGSLAAPENGMLSIDNTTFASSVIYSCIEGYNIAGDEMRTCLENGSWSGQDPSCLSECMCMLLCVLYVCKSVAVCVMYMYVS